MELESRNMSKLGNWKVPKSMAGLELKEWPEHNPNAEWNYHKGTWTAPEGEGRYVMVKPYHYSTKPNSDTYLSSKTYKNKHESALANGFYRIQFYAPGFKPSASLASISNQVKKSADPYQVIATAYSTEWGVTYDWQPKYDPATKPVSNAKLDNPYEKSLRKMCREYKKKYGLTHYMARSFNSVYGGY